MQTAPRPGDVVWIRRRRWRVERAARDRAVVRLDVAWRGRRRTFLTPFDQVAPVVSTRMKRVRIQEAIARAAAAMARAPEFRLPLAMLDASADILPHQLEPALAFIAGHTRILLADEVGLGKTIQAGLVVSELCRRQSAPRILIVVPAALRAQWKAELGQRFGIECLHADRHELEARSAAGAFGANPWQQSGVWLASTDFLKQAHVLEMLPRDAWDLFVIDEAHGVCGDSARYHACHDVARRSRRVLLLTATPHSGDAARFARLSGLGFLDVRPESTTGCPTHAQVPLVFRRTREELGIDRRRRISWHTIRLKDAESAAITALFDFERAALNNTSQSLLENTRLLLSVFRKRALSTFAALSRSLTRRLEWLGDEHNDTSARADWTQAALAFDDEDSEESALAIPIGLDRRHEGAWLRRLRQLADDASRSESKIAWLDSLIERIPEPVVVFSEFRDSIDAIERRLRRSRAIAVMHGGQDERTQRAELARYLAGAASVLLATDVAGQGLNLQSRGRWVVSLELPWNPARLEQRLGRVDRLGQTRAPHLSVLVARHDAERGLLAHLARRVLSAQRSFSTDALRDLIPPEAQVRDSLLSGEPTAITRGSSTSQKHPETEHPHSLPPLELCRRWERPARVIARELRRRRSLARRWRAGPIETARIIRTDLRCRPRLPDVPATLHSGNDVSIVIGGVPVLNRQHEVIERRVVAMVVDSAAPGGFHLRSTEFAKLCRRLVESSLRRRVLKLARASGDAAARLADRETARLAFLLADAKRREVQPGLFDAREIRRSAVDEAEVERQRSLSERELLRLRAFAGITLGDFEPEIVLNRTEISLQGLGPHAR